MKICAHCRDELPETLQIVKSSTCPFCRSDLKTCTNCVFYRPGSHWDCTETISEPVREKERANFCDFFRFNQNRTTDTGGTTNAKEKKAHNDFSELFGDD